MRTLLISLFIITCLTSCSTLLSRKTYKVNFKTNTQNAKVKIADSLYSIPAKIPIRRSKRDLEMTLVTDSASRKFKMQAIYDPNFIYTNWALSIYGPFGHLIDLTNQKRFHYGKEINLNLNDTNYILKPITLKSYPKGLKQIRILKEKGDLYYYFSLPHINSFTLFPNSNGYTSSIGFWGVAGGFDYYTKQSEFINLRFSAVSDFPIPVPGAVRFTGPFEIITSRYVALSKKYETNFSTLGIGIAFGRNIWRINNIKLPANNKESIFEKEIILGLIFPAYVKFGNYSKFGFVYRPTFIRFTSDVNFKYEHLISFEYSYKIKGFKFKSKKVNKL